MKLSSIFLGAAMIWGGLAGPGIYHQMQDEEATVRAKVLGKVEIVDDPVHSYRRYEVYTTAGKFNTLDMLNGSQIQAGASYTFNLKGGTWTAWPPSSSRNIQSVKQIAPPAIPPAAEKGPGT